MINFGEFKKYILFCVLTVCLFALVKIFSIVPFTRLSADDFAYGGTVLTEGFLKSQEYWYLNWSGRFSSTFIQTSFGYIQGDGKNIIFSITTYIALLVAFYTFISNHFKTDKFNTILMSILSFSFLYQLSTNKMENWYWMSGSATYLWPIIFTMFSLSTKSRLLSIILAFVAAGSNETFALISSVIYMSLLLFSQTKKRYLYLAIGSIVGLVVVSMAPGNNVRSMGEGSDPMNLMGSILYSIQTGPKVLWLMAKSNIGLVISLPLVLATFIKQKNSFNLQNILFVLSSLVFISMLYVFPGYKVLGRIPPDRSDITLAFLVLISMIYIANNLSSLVNKYSYLSLVGSALLFLSVFSFTNTIAEDVYITRNYSDSFDNMIFKLKEGNENTDIYIDKLPKSGLVPNAQIKSDQYDWMNVAVAKYYGVKSIIAK